MNSRYILVVGAIISAVYIWVSVLLQTDKSSDSLKYLFILDNDSVVVVAKLPDSDISKDLVDSLKSKCKSLKCSIDSSFSKDLKESKEINFFKDLQEFSLSKKLSHASLVAVNKDVEINFLLKSQKELESLKSIYKPYEDKFFIKDKSSIVKVFDVGTIESDINMILEDKKELLKVLNLDLKTKKLLNQIFRKIKALGSVKVDFLIDTDRATEDLKEYILKSYSWVKDINITKGEKNSIKIKEVQ